MIESILDGLVDTLKILPYLFVTFLLLEYIEHRLSAKTQNALIKHKKLGPVLGGVLGGFPQCGFGAMAANLFTNRVITMGTLIAVFLSTSDEMLPIMLGENIPIAEVLKIIGFKIIIGVGVGLVVDFFFGSKIDSGKSIKNMCNEEHCHCKNGIFVSSVFHTLKTGLFVLIANLVFGTIIYFLGEESLAGLLDGQNIFVYFAASLIGLIPNCAASVILTEAYVSGIVPIGVAMAGLLTGSGVGILLLFKNNKNTKENLVIVSTIYFVGVLVGLLVDFCHLFG